MFTDQALVRSYMRGTKQGERPFIHSHGAVAVCVVSRLTRLCHLVMESLKRRSTRIEAAHGRATATPSGLT